MLMKICLELLIKKINITRKLIIKKYLVRKIFKKMKNMQNVQDKMIMQTETSYRTEN